MRYIHGARLLPKLALEPENRCYVTLQCSHELSVDHGAFCASSAIMVLKTHPQ